MASLLKRGSQGRDVKAVQNALNFHLRLLTPLSVDGIFGQKTDERVRHFQRLHALAVDGVVGPRTTDALFEIETFTARLLFTPRLTSPSPPGFKLPPLVPPLQPPGIGPAPSLPPPVVPGPQIRLFRWSSTPLTTLDRPLLLDFKLTAPVRKDPSDPSVAARTNLVRMVDQSPVNASFRAFLISKVPNPVKSIAYPTPGFDRSLNLPSFNPLSPDKIGLFGDARYFIHVAGALGSPLPFVTLGAWGDAKVEPNYRSQQGRAGFTPSFQGNVFLGAKGVF